jgi:hypothetical protein
MVPGKDRDQTAKGVLLPDDDDDGQGRGLGP